MPHWLIKSAVHRVISWMPRRHKCNEWFQEHVTKSLGLSAGAFELRLNIARRIFEDLLRVSPACAGGFTALEIGTGWHPIVPIALYVCGATEIWTYDIDPLLRGDRLLTVLNYFCEHESSGKLKQLLPAARPERIARLRELAQSLPKETAETILEKLNIHALLRDARDTGLKAGSVDLFFSCVVFEFIPAPIQLNLYTEFSRIASQHAVMVLLLDLKDQFSTFDRSITPLNFLKYSSGTWKWLDSPLIPQTRLRPSDYRTILTQAGYHIIKEICVTARPETLDRIRIAPEFKKYNREDLLAVEEWLVAAPPRNGK